VELKRLEHERQRLLQRKMFENQMRALEQQQQQELLSIPYDGGIQHVAVSAPTTPPRQNSGLPNSFVPSGLGKSVDVDLLSRAVGTAAENKRKSVTYAPETISPDSLHASTGFSRAGGHKSMPASRRTSASEHDEDLADHLQNLSLIGEKSSGHNGSPALTLNGQPGVHMGNGYNAGVMLDEQLDQEMHSEFHRRRLT
jgi:hypothetical protein